MMDTICFQWEAGLDWTGSDRTRLNKTGGFGCPGCGCCDGDLAHREKVTTVWDSL